MDQTRGWFLLAACDLDFAFQAETHIATSSALTGRRPEGKKASKSRGTCLARLPLFDTFGTDAVRWYFYTSTQVGENYRTGRRRPAETVHQFFIPLWNCYSSSSPTRGSMDLTPQCVVARRRARPVAALQSEWAEGRPVSVASTPMTQNEPARRIHRFVDDLSNWYIRRRAGVSGSHSQTATRPPPIRPFTRRCARSAS